MDGVFIVDKPRGLTSHDVVRLVRKKIKSRAVGHAGTLDPMATGVLVIAVGEATKLVPYLTAADKEYETTIAIGVTTETLDADAQHFSNAPVPDDWRGHLEAALAEERHRKSQIPPDFSAIHTQGERAHEIARRGETVELAPREIHVLSLQLLEATASPPTVALRLSVSKGYYVRALARDISARLGTVGHLIALRRIRSGPFSISDAGTLEDENFSTHILSVSDAAKKSLPSITLDDAARIDAGHGKTIHVSDDAARGATAWLDDGGNLIAIGHVADDGSGRVLRGFNVSAK
ncbi:MAG: tRNA pseudouridine(55) synthase TruB [Polyangiaceae bacterium]